jgi:hypothetical protein
MFKELKKFLLPNQDELLSVESISRESVIFLKQLFLSEKLTKIEYVFKLYSESKKHPEILVQISDFLLLDALKSAKVEAKKTDVVSTDAMLGDMPSTATVTDNVTQNGPQEQNMLKKDSPVEKGHINVSVQEQKKNIDDVQQEKLKLLGEFLVTVGFKKLDKLEKLKKDDENYKKRLKLLGDFLLSKIPNDDDEDERVDFEEKFEDVLKIFDITYDSKTVITEEDQMLTSETDPNEALNMLEDYLKSSSFNKEEDLKKLSSDCEKHSTTLVLLGEFLMSEGPKDLKVSSIKPTEIMLGDSSMPSRTTDFRMEEVLTTNGAVHQMAPQINSQQSDISTNVQLQDDLVLLDISQKDKLKLLGEFLIKEIDPEYNEEALESFLKKNKGYKNRLNFIGEFILSNNLTEKNEYKKMCSEKSYKKMMNLLKNSKPFIELLKIHSGDVSDLKNAYQEVLASLKQFILPDTQANINSLETLSSKSNEHRQVLVLLGNFLLFDESTILVAHKNNKSSSLKVYNEEGTMQGDSPTINRKAGVSYEGDLEGKKVDEGESLILEKGKYLQSIKSGLPKPNKLRNVKKKAKNNSVIVNKSDSRVDEAVSKPFKSESRTENLVVVKNEKDLNSATAEKPKTYDKENFGDSFLKNLANDHIRSNSEKLESQKVYKQAINPNDPKRNNHLRTPDSVNRKYVVTGKSKISKPRDIEVKPQNTSQKKGLVHVVGKLKNEEVKNPITLTFTVTRSNK